MGQNAVSGGWHSGLLLSGLAEGAARSVVLTVTMRTDLTGNWRE